MVRVFLLKKSSINLDTQQGAMELVTKLCDDARQTGRPTAKGGLSWCARQKEEDPAEPEGLEVEPEESEDS